jgi:hypothetical protein
MADNVQGRRGRRGRWLVLAALLVVAAWVVRSRRGAAADPGTGWPTPRPTGAGAEWQLPGTDGTTARPATSTTPAPVAAAPARRSESSSAPSPGPAATSLTPTATATGTPTAATPGAAPGAVRRPSPRPRTAAPAAPAPVEDLPPGAAPSLPDGSAPGPQYTIKGNAGSKLFHSPTSPYFTRTKAEYWFRTAEDARAAGFTEWTPRKR